VREDAPFQNGSESGISANGVLCSAKNQGLEEGGGDLTRLLAGQSRRSGARCPWGAEGKERPGVGSVGHAWGRMAGR